MLQGAALWMGGLALMTSAQPSLAHPHVFIDTGIEVAFDATGLATGIRVTWTYDAFYALIIIEERGLDTDGNGALTEAERTSLDEVERPAPTASMC